MNRLCIKIAVLSLAISLSAQAAERQQPNLVIITADNLGYGDLGCFGNRVMKTPHLDAFSAEGVRCTDFYTASPTCTVSRASLLTGRYPQRHKLTYQLPGIKGNYGVGLRHSEVLLPEILQRVGYRTFCVGKWNIGFAAGSRPTDRGFDLFFGHASGNMDYYRHVYNGKLDLHRQTDPVRVEGYCTDLFAEEACRLIRAHRHRPFFLYLPFNAPHYPNPRNKRPGEPCVWQAPDEAFAACDIPPDTNDPELRYRAVVTALDAAIGRVLRQLEESGVAERTLVVFFSDNGAFMLPDRGLEVASNRPLRDGGVTLWEGGIRVPCLVRWPGRLPAGRVCRAPLLSCDLFVLCAVAAGAQLPADRVIDGLDPTATLTGRAPSPHDCLFFQYRSFAAVRQGRFKLLRTRPDQAWMLFDLHQDLGETRDLASQQPARVAELARRYEHWRRETETE